MPISEESLSHLWPFKRKISLFLAVLGVFLVGCSTYNLEKMPRYDIKESYDRYDRISEAENQYYTVGIIAHEVVQGAKKIDPRDAKTYQMEVDKYVWWISVAKIQLFYGQYEQSNKSVDKAEQALEKVKSVLMDIYKND